MFSGVGKVQNAHCIWSIAIGNSLAPLGSVRHRTHLLDLRHLAPLHLPGGEFEKRGGIRQARKIGEIAYMDLRLPIGSSFAYRLPDGQGSDLDSLFVNQRDHGSVGTHHAPFQHRLLWRNVRGFPLTFLHLNHIHPSAHLLGQATGSFRADLHPEQIAKHPSRLLEWQTTGQMHKVFLLTRSQASGKQGELLIEGKKARVTLGTGAIGSAQRHRLPSVSLQGALMLPACQERNRTGGANWSGLAWFLAPLATGAGLRRILEYLGLQFHHAQMNFVFHLDKSGGGVCLAPFVDVGQDGCAFLEPSLLIHALVPYSFHLMMTLLYHLYLELSSALQKGGAHPLLDRSIPSADHPWIAAGMFHDLPLCRSQLPPFPAFSHLCPLLCFALTEKTGRRSEPGKRHGCRCASSGYIRRSWA